MKQILLLIVAAWGVAAHAQKIVDTLDTPNGPMVVYDNRTWQYVCDLEFDGVMNHRLHDEVVNDTNIHFKQSWDHEVCYTSELTNDPSALTDTIWICVEHDLTEGFYMPFNGVITSSFGLRKGRNHNGTDIDLATGDTVKAAWSGKIRYAKFNEGGFGNLVIIRHENGLETFYAHLDKHLVVPNMEVKAGDPIGLGGNTGHSFGSHLHFEVRFYDIPIDPEHIIDFAKKEVRDENLLVHERIFRRGNSRSGSNDRNYVAPDTEVGHDQPSVASTSSSSSSSSSSSAKKYYKIRSGDTLTSIARIHKTTVSKICQLNGIKESTILQIGRNLRVR